MKKYIFVSIIACMIFYPFISFSSYLIKLNNNTEFVTEEYWEEGDQLMFYYLEGLISVNKDMLIDIQSTDSEAPIAENNSPEPIPTPNRRAPVKVNAVDTQKKKAQPTQAAISTDKGSLLAEKKRLEKEIQYYRDILQTAKQEKDLEKVDEAWEKLRQLQKQLSALENTARSANQGNIPEWWEDRSKKAPSVKHNCEKDADCLENKMCLDGFCA